MTEAVIYSLVHVPTCHFYIGATRNPIQRSKQWRIDLGTALRWCRSGHWRRGCTVPRAFFEVGFPWQVDDWEFCAPLERVTLRSAKQREQAHIELGWVTGGQLCLNRMNSTYGRESVL